MSWKSTGLTSREVPEGAMREVLVGEQPILLIHRRGQILAFPGRCPHEGGVLAEGQLEQDRVVCPVHGATFALPAGTIVADPDGITPPSGDVPSLIPLKTRTVADTIEVELS